VPISTGTNIKFVGAYRAADNAAVLNGGTVGTATGAVPTVNRLLIGQIGGGQILNGWVTSLIYYPTRLPNTQLQQLTTPAPATPSLTLDFATMTALPSTVSFSRPSNATMYDATGKLTYAPNNLATYSQDFTNAAWTKTNLTVSGNVVTASAGNATHRLQTAGAAVYANFVFTLEAAAGTLRYIQLYNGTNAELYANFDLQAGTVGTFGTLTTASIVNLGGGRYRCIAVWGSFAAGANNFISMGTASNNAYGPTFNATGTETFTVYQAQLEAVTYQTTPSTYVATTSAAYYGPRLDYNPATLAPNGLLIEEARTNLFSNSGSIGGTFWSNVATTFTLIYGVAPDGTTSSTRIQFPVATSAARIVQTPASGTGATTFSVWIRGTNGSSGSIGLQTQTSPGVDGLTTVNFTGTWQRFSATYTATVGGGTIGIRNDTANAVDIEVWGAQLEAGAFFTSYIPTAASSVARSADVASLTGTALTLLQATQWTAIAKATTASYANFPALIGGQASTGMLTMNNGRGARAQTNTGASTLDTANVVSGVNVPFTAGVATSVGGKSIALNGGTVATDTGSIGGIAVQFYLGNNGSNVSALNGWVATLTLYNTRLYDSQLQQLTT
jgi:hypothetical protein